MPNRIIKESITNSETLDTVSAEAERLFVRLIVVCDDYGRFDARPNIIIGRCFPLKIGMVKPNDVNSWLSKLEIAGLITRYETDGHAVLQMTTWEKHQQIRARHSKYPDPCHLQPTTPVEESSPSVANNGNHLLADASYSPRKRETRNEKRETNIRAANAADPCVPEIFKCYQEKIQPAARLIDAARDKIKSRLKTFSRDDLLLAVDHMAADSWWMEANGRRGAAWFFESDARIEMLVNLVPNARPSSNNHAEPVPWVGKVYVQGN